MTQLENAAATASQFDAEDKLRHFREQFIIPQHEGNPAVYLCGNSLGLQPRTTRHAILAELDHWAIHGVEGHFKGDMPWMFYHRFLTEQTAHVVGALPHEVVVMNTLTVNLHLLMVSFYRPTPSRYKIIMEAGAFPSDQYAVETRVRLAGFDPLDAIIEVAPRAGEDILRTSDILDTIEKHGEQAALVMFGGVNYYTGQFYDLEAITETGHRVGAKVGFDLAHAAGNIALDLHHWGPDFAVWCSYKYLNSGPGGPSGVFVHERHADDASLPRFAGWWGHNEAERFKMQKGYKPMYGAEGWQISNAQIFSFAAHKASLDLFVAAGMSNLREKSVKLSSFLYQLLLQSKHYGTLFQIITPENPHERGCQISMLTNAQGKSLYDHLSQHGVICDWREPNVIRIAPVPLYNTFEEAYRFATLVEQF